MVTQRGKKVVHHPDLVIPKTIVTTTVILAILVDTEMIMSQDIIVIEIMELSDDMIPEKTDEQQQNIDVAIFQFHRTEHGLHVIENDPFLRHQPDLAHLTVTDTIGPNALIVNVLLPRQER